MTFVSSPGGSTFNGGTVTEAVLIDGSQDANQLIVKGHTTQTVDLFRVQLDTGVNYLSVGSVGTVDIGPLSRRLQVNSTGTGLNGNAAIAKAAAITAPTAPGAAYVQAEAQSAVTAINSIRTALTNIGITA